jgi:heptosyltransferase-2
MKVLIIQTAFLGDVVLATSVVEKIHSYYPDAHIDFLLRKGNEGLLRQHPYISTVYTWEKDKNKTLNLFRVILQIRKERYDYLFNLQRFFSTGMITVFSRANHTIGYDKNPLSVFFKDKANHEIGGERNHEIDRYNELIAPITDRIPAKPKLYPSEADFKFVSDYKTTPYITLAPTSVWFTKQFPAEKWIEFVHIQPSDLKIYLLGSAADLPVAETIQNAAPDKQIVNLCGKLSLLQTAALVAGARRNYTNDSAPLHIASAMNAPLTAVFCSTVPEFGFGPLSDDSKVIEVQEKLPCRPCGLHGKKSCPLQHFKCAYAIKVEQFNQ